MLVVSSCVATANFYGSLTTNNYFLTTIMRVLEIRVNGEFAALSGKRAGVRGEGNATELRITFDASWDGYAKRLLWLDARGKEATAVLLDDGASVERPPPDGGDGGGDSPPGAVARPTWVTYVPGEALRYSGWCALVVQGYSPGEVEGDADGDGAYTPTSIAKSVTIRLEVAPSPERYTPPAEPTATQAEQLLAMFGRLESETDAKLAEQDTEIAAFEGRVGDELTEMRGDAEAFKGEVRGELSGMQDILDSYGPSITVYNAQGLPAWRVSNTEPAPDELTLGGIWFETERPVMIGLNNGGGELGVWDKTWVGAEPPPNDGTYSDWIIL